MKYIILLLAIVVFAGEYGPDLMRTRELPFFVENQQVVVFEIDGCEYLGTRSFAFTVNFLTHKGNCKYCLERQKKTPTLDTTLQPTSGYFSYGR